MQRRSLLFLTCLLPLGVLTPRRLRAFSAASTQPIDYQEKARRLNELAANIRTPADARRLIDFVADIFREDLPPRAVGTALRDRLSQAEFLAVTDPHALIREERIAEVWNTYVENIHAPVSCQVTPAEVHNLRDAFFATANLSWKRGMQNMWSVPAIYASQADGTLAPGCRAIESIRLFWDLANMPDNLISARARVKDRVLASDLFKKANEHPASGVGHGRVTFGPASSNPAEIAERKYVAENGINAFGSVLIAMIDQMLS